MTKKAKLKQFVPACIRTGMCCENVLLALSPRQLREGFRNWRDDKPNTTRLTDIWLIAPMLEGRCRGKYLLPSSRPGCPKFKYVYGPCKNLAYEDGPKGKRMATCTIHEDRPHLCRGYPMYGAQESVEMRADAVNHNPGYMKGCGYNADPKDGTAPEEFGPKKLLALSKDEK